MAVVVWARVVFVGQDGSEIAACVLAGPGAPDLAAVDVLARAALSARQAGGSILLRDTCRELGDLLDLAGLRREVGGQAEGDE